MPPPTHDPLYHDQLIQGHLFKGISTPWIIPASPNTSDIRYEFSSSDAAHNAKSKLKDSRELLKESHHVLMAGRQFAVLAIFQALDAGGKDGAIREVFEGLDPAGVSVAAFKKPTPEELAHDFLWRTSRKLPPKGMIGIFNRSYYEEVLAVRVHPEFLDGQYAGSPPAADLLWPERYRAIRAHERHLVSCGTVVLKFWLNVSPSRQARRFLDRLEDPTKNWKFSLRDLQESERRAAYDEAVKEMFIETSTAWAPWFCIPADDRWYARWQIAEIVRQTLKALPLNYPKAALLEANAEQLARQLAAKTD